MKRMLQSTRFRGSLGRTPRSAGGLWAVAGESLEPLDSSASATLLVPTEQVLVLAVDLPIAGRAKRLEALPFAIEERIADPVQAVHLALGRETSPRRYLAGVVDHALMRRWQALAEANGLGGAAIVPDALALPMPAEGEWSVATIGPRTLVRRDDGTGFAVPAAAFDAAWTAGGRPRIVEAQPVAPKEIDLDLAQGPYAARGPQWPWRRLAIVAAAGLAAHGAIAAADTLALNRIATRWKAETAAQVAKVSPGADVNGDLAAIAADLVPAGSGGPPSRFLALLDRAAPALSSGVKVNRIAFDGAANTLTIALDGDQARAAAALAAAGLTVKQAPGTLIVGGGA